MNTQTVAATAQSINDLRRRIIEGQDVTEDELRSAIAYIHQLRGKAVAADADKPARGGKSKPMDPAAAQKLLDTLII